MNSRRPRYAGNLKRLLVVIGLVVIGAIGCGNDSTGPDLNPSFMVGDWLADSVVVTAVADPAVVVDLTALGLVFTLSVQPSGRYTSISSGFGLPGSEIGDLTVDGIHVVFMPRSPPGEDSRAVWELVGDSVILESESEFDFDLDGTTEAATLRRVLIPK